MSRGELRPAVLTSALQPWADVGEALHRRLLSFGNAEDAWEILWVGPGAARAAAWRASRLEAHVSAVDPSPAAVAFADKATRSAGIAGRVTLQTGHAHDLPHTEAVFDMVIVTLTFDPQVDAAAALGQATRVVRPKHPVVAAVPVWPGTPVEEAEPALAEIGVRPRFLTQWKQLARDAGLVEITAEAAMPSGAWLSDGIVGPVARGWNAGGLDGARTLLSAPVRAFRQMARSRTVDLAVVRGLHWPSE